MIEFLSEMQFWHWMVFGFALMAVEALAPGAFFLWPGLAAILVGLIVGLIPSLPWTASVGLWAVLSVVTAVAWIYYRRKNPSGATPLSMLNRRGEQYIGQRFTLELSVRNRGSRPVRVQALEPSLPAGWSAAAAAPRSATGSAVGDRQTYSTDARQGCGEPAADGEGGP